MKTLLAITATALLLVGCASAPRSSIDLDSKAKTFVPEPGKASIYIQRNAFHGWGVVFQLVLDGRIVGSLAQNRFQLLSVSPGEHTFALIGGYVKNQQVRVETGKNYFYNASIRMSLGTGGAHIEPISEVEGRKKVMNSKRAETIDY